MEEERDSLKRELQQFENTQNQQNLQVNEVLKASERKIQVLQKQISKFHECNYLTGNAAKLDMCDVSQQQHQCEVISVL